MSFPDRLAAAVRRAESPLCVGLDPRWDALPAAVRRRHADSSLSAVAAAFAEFSLKVLELVAPYCGVVKPQSAFFEMCGPDGLAALQQVLRRAKDLGLVTILDSKRGDIASTASADADAALAGVSFHGTTIPVWDADSITVNPYLGRDAVEPFLQSARRAAKGVFVLVRTSNPGAGLFQDLPSAGRPLFHHVAAAVGSWARENLNADGFGDVGAVVGATAPAELAEVRRLIPECWLLVPGYGAQGGSAADVAGAFRADGLGAVVNSSRGVTFPFHPDDPQWEQAVIAAAQRAANELSR